VAGKEAKNDASWWVRYVMKILCNTNDA